MHGPTLAEQARTALAASTVATLLTRSCAHARTLTVVTVAADAEGRPLLWLEDDSPVVPLLAGGRAATIRVAGSPPYRSLEMTGPLEQLPSDRPGLRRYRMRLLAVGLVGATRRPIAVAEFASAEPDPLRDCSDAVLRHLEQAHGAELVACLHAQGLHDVSAVVPQSLDRYGITLAALCHDGVRSLRLQFPDGPVRSVRDIAVGLRAPLTCRCRPSEPQEE
jgi:hypothetical protein